MGSLTKSLEVVIDRPVADVFAYVSDPENLPEWLSGIKDIRKSAPKMAVGTTYGYTRRFLGRSVDGTTTVTAYDPPKRYAYSVTSGEMVLDVSYDLEPLGNGTLLNFGLNAEVGGIFGIAPGLAVGQYEKDLATLKEILQGPAYGHDVPPEGDTGTVVKNI